MRLLIHSSIAGNCWAEKSASAMMRSCERAATMRPPEVSHTGAKFASSVACAASVKFVIRFDGEVLRNEGPCFAVSARKIIAHERPREIGVFGLRHPRNERADMLPGSSSVSAIASVSFAKLRIERGCGGAVVTHALFRVRGLAAEPDERVIGGAVGSAAGEERDRIAQIRGQRLRVLDEQGKASACFGQDGLVAVCAEGARSVGPAAASGRLAPTPRHPSRPDRTPAATRREHRLGTPPCPACPFRCGRSARRCRSPGPTPHGCSSPASWSTSSKKSAGVSRSASIIAQVSARRLTRSSGAICLNAAAQRGAARGVVDAPGNSRRRRD